MRDLTPVASKINSRIGKAIHDYNLIGDGDRILVAVSGGKDSLTLLKFLTMIRKWAPVKFDILSVHIKNDLRCGGCMHEDVLSDIFGKMEVDFRFKEIKVLDAEGKTTCFWCSWTRRKALFELAEEAGCNKVALGHHRDDIVETILMNLIYRGEISAMNPRQELFNGKLIIIRPLCYVDEDETREFAKESGFPEQLCKCPFGRDSKRKYIKDFIKKTNIDAGHVDIKTNIYSSISRIKREYIDLKE